MAEDEKNEKFEEIKDTIEEAKDKIEDKFEDVKDDVKETINNIKKEVDDYTSELDPKDVESNKVMAILAYFGILVLIPIFAAKDSKFAKFHANQGLILFIICFACAILSSIKFIGWIFSIVEVVVGILAIIGIIYAAQGKAKELPVVGNWKILK